MKPHDDIRAPSVTVYRNGAFLNLSRNVLALFVLLIGLGMTGCGAENDSKTKNKPATAEGQRSALIDINRADANELMGLKGIGEARAKAIINGRPYGRKDDLVRKKIVPQSIYHDIKDKIIARQQ